MSVATVTRPFSRTALPSTVGPYRGAETSAAVSAMQSRKQAFVDKVSDLRGDIRTAISDIELTDDALSRRDVGQLLNGYGNKIGGGSGLSSDAPAWTNTKLAGLRTALNDGVGQLSASFAAAPMSEQGAMLHYLQSQASDLAKDIGNTMQSLGTEQLEREAEAKKTGAFRTGVNSLASGAYGLGAGIVKSIAWGRKTEDDKPTEADDHSAIPQTNRGSAMPNSLEYGPDQPVDRYTLTRYPEYQYHMDDRSTVTSESEEQHLRSPPPKPHAMHRGPQFQSQPTQKTAPSVAPSYAGTAQSQHVLVHAPTHSMVRSQPVAYSGLVPQVSTFASAAPSFNINVNSNAASAYMKYRRREQLEQSFQNARMALARSELVDDVEQSIGRLQNFEAGFGTSSGGGSVFGAFPAVPMRSGLGSHFSAMSVSNSFVQPSAVSVGYF